MSNLTIRIYFSLDQNYIQSYVAIIGLFWPYPTHLKWPIKWPTYLCQVVSSVVSVNLKGRPRSNNCWKPWGNLATGWNEDLTPGWLSGVLQCITSKNTHFTFQYFSKKIFILEFVFYFISQWSSLSKNWPTICCWS